MTTDTALIEKREELKRRLAAGEYKTLIDVSLEWFERLLRKVARRQEPLPLWIVTLTIYIILQLISFTGITFAGHWAEYEKYNVYGVPSDIGILIDSLIGFLFVASVTIINQFTGRLVVLWRETIIDITESKESLKAFQKWLDRVCNHRLHFLVILIPNIVSIPGVIQINSGLIGKPISLDLLFPLITIDLIAWAIIYQLIMLIIFAAKLRDYDLALFSTAPGSSKVIFQLSGELSFLVYYVAFFATILTLGTVASNVQSLSLLYISLWVSLWVPIIALFILNQTSLASMIRRAKWKTLNEVQAKIEKLRTSKSFGTPKTMDAISKLMDYHDRVKATRNSAIDSSTIANFINSLLLPLLAFILGNLDQVIALFARKP